MATQGRPPPEPVPFTAVRVEDEFWRPRLETNRRETLPYCFRKCEETGRIANFDRAAGRLPGSHEGIFFNDSDVFKILEGAAYTLALSADPELDAYVDDLIERIGAAQEADGYLYTARTIDPAAVNAAEEGETRWSNLAVNHELYNVGHMYEAAVAHYQATGKRALLDIALRNADLICRVFGPEGIHDVPGHQEIELGLIRLHQATGRRRYLDMAHFFLAQRGCHARRSPVVRFGNPGYMQDHLPVAEQTEAVGHAVRAGYMYAGMADVVALRDEPAWRHALTRLWDDVVRRKLYLHGGIGARHEGEAFGDAYELPNATAYAETCAAIANVYWNHRMFLLTGDVRYMDVLELSLYNCVLAGIGLNGREFFYPNPLSSDGEWKFNKGQVARQAWFDCSCCPANLVRFLPALPGWIYAVRDARLHVNLYVGSQVTCTLQPSGVEVTLRQETRYPWEGRVRLSLELAQPTRFELALRVPGWRTAPAPGDLYTYHGSAPAEPRVECSRTGIEVRRENGCWMLEGTWHGGDAVELDLPMPVRTVQCHPAVSDNRNRTALMRGPLVYCVEGQDARVPLSELRVATAGDYDCDWRSDRLGGHMAITGGQGDQTFRAIPYHLWAHRGTDAMTVWLNAA